MTGSLRYVLAMAFVALYFLVPEPDTDRSAYLQSRVQLMDGGDSPLAGFVDAGRLPPLAVTFIPEVEDPGERTERAEAWASTAREWARMRTESGTSVQVDPDLAPLAMSVRTGQDGARIEIFATGSRVQPPPEPVQMDSIYPARTSLMPAFLAIILALLTGKIMISLFLGCALGALLHVGMAPVAGGTHLFVDVFWNRVLLDTFHLWVIGFVLVLFMAVGVMSRSGGLQGMVAWIRKLARGPTSTLLCSYVIGLLIFFDDYSNCIITGTTMRPLSDRMGISREKLAYVVDSTAAPVAGISIFSTWVAYEVSMFAGQLPEVTDAQGTPYTESQGFQVFLETLPFRFYCIFTLGSVLLMILLKRDWGPMLRAERRARLEGKPIADDATPMVSKKLADIEAPEGVPHRGRGALIPLLLLITTTIGLIWYFGAYDSDGNYQVPAEKTGFLEKWQWVMGATDSAKALCLGSVVALVVAAGMALVERVLGIGEVIRSAVRSASALFFAVVILVLAWGIGEVCRDLGTAYYLTAAFHDRFPPVLLPVVMFLLAALVAFATGTSYGTMAILLPNVVVLAHTLGSGVEPGFGSVLMVLTIGAVLEGSIFGDHCSPISDTTVLSSVATASDHLHHVRTQAPYALLTMGVAIVCGYLPMVFFGTEYWWAAWLAGFAVLAAFMLVFGRNPAEPETV